MKLKLLALTSLLLINSNLIKAQNTNTGTEAGNAGTNNSAFGYYAGNVVTGNNNSFVGYFAGQANTIGEYNSFFGANSGINNTSGKDNAFFGYKSGRTNISGEKNVFIGRESGYSNTFGNLNTFIGYESGYSNSSGQVNVFLGVKSGYSNTVGGLNVLLGYKSGYYNTTGSNNIFTGYESGYHNLGGSYNISSGYQSGQDNISGNYNLCMGYRSGMHNSTGSYNIFIGHQAGYWETGSNRLYIDNSENSHDAIPLIYGKFDTDQLGINTKTIPTGYTMAVKGKFITEEIKVQQYGTSGWPDFVFHKNYNLPTLKEVENYINTNGHLQNIPSANEVSENGILLGEMNAKLLQKIEELTLHAIKQQKKIEDQNIAMEVLAARLTALENK